MDDWQVMNYLLIWEIQIVIVLYVIKPFIVDQYRSRKEKYIVIKNVMVGHKEGNQDIAKFVTKSLVAIQP